jgi:citrate synthase
MTWLTAPQALAALGVRPQTLYANVSRGRIRAKPNPKDSRRSLYNNEDVKRLAVRRSGRRSADAIAADAIRWGDPVLESSISTVAQGRLWYRGQDACALSDVATLEQVAELLWQVENVQFGERRRAAKPASSPLAAALVSLARRAATAPPSYGRSRSVLAIEAADLIDAVASAMLGSVGPPSAALHRRMAGAWRARKAEDILRRTLVLLADHELNASTFAARVAVSTRAPLSAGLVAGLATLAGPLHGGASIGVRLLTTGVQRVGAAAAVRDWLGQGHPLPAFGHPLYADGDPRAIVLFEHFKPRPAFVELRAAVESMTGEQPNIDFAIAAMADAFGLPPAASFVLFAVARSVGWIAHALEQSATGSLIRPRARYIGPPLAPQPLRGPRNGQVKRHRMLSP